MKSRTFLIIGVVLSVVALGYVAYALANPQATGPIAIIGYNAAMILYRVYLAVTALMYLTAVILKLVNKSSK